MSFTLATLNAGGVALAAVGFEGRYWRFEDAAPGLVGPQGGLIDLFQDWDHALARLREVDFHAAGMGSMAMEFQGEGPAFMTPLLYPPKVVLTGTNYTDHVRGVGHAHFNKAENFPAFFFKPPRTCLVGPGKTVRYPEQSAQLDWEVELAVVIGRRARRVSAGQALEYVAAYTIGIDLSARDIQNNPRHYVKKDLCLGKGFDDSCPLGPELLPACFVKDPKNLALRLFVNGVLEQDSNTSCMIWSVAEQIEEITRHMTLEPGDVLLTGTPAGCGIEKGRFLKIGDTVRAEIDSLGSLEIEIMPQGK